MGVTPASTEGSCGKEAGRGAARQAAALTAPAAPAAAGGLAAVLGSEDTLFRDPFADFTPSGR